jgi:hypothetical protein
MWKMNAARSTFTGGPQPKSLAIRIEPHQKGELFTVDRIETDGRATSSSTILYLDSRRLHERLTVKYGLGWTFDGNLNHDLRKPPLLAPLLGTDGLGPTRKRWTNFSPILGLAWAPSKDGKTVICAGAGLFYGLQGIGQFAFCG